MYNQNMFTKSRWNICYFDDKSLSDGSSSIYQWCSSSSLPLVFILIKVSCISILMNIVVIHNPLPYEL